MSSWVTSYIYGGLPACLQSEIKVARRCVQIHSGKERDTGMQSHKDIVTNGEEKNKLKLKCQTMSELGTRHFYK